MASAKLAAIGFSAGGHLSASLAMRHGMPTYTPVAAADQQDDKPIVAAHMYPVITMGDGAHAGSRDKLLGENPSRRCGGRLVAGAPCRRRHGAVLRLPCGG